MDTYVRHFGANKQHDDFYSDDTILEKFKNYTTTIVSRYVNSPAVFGWELANDPRFVDLMSCGDVQLTQVVTGAILHCLPVAARRRL
jgi:mannan endo-1,4-beta-mannosidase